jgi:hypothetical protein
VIHALLVDVSEGSGARSAAAAGAVAAMSVEAKVAIIRAGGGVLAPLVLACGPWAPEALIHYLTTAPDTRYVGAVARALRAAAEGAGGGGCRGSALLPAVSGWVRRRRSTQSNPC